METDEAWPGCSPEEPMSIGQLHGWAQAALRESIPDAWVQGEISDLSRPSSGHCYLTLKDSEHQVRAVVWRSSAARIAFDLRDGQEVLCYGRLDIYAPRGTYQFVIQKMQPLGIGPLQLAFKQLHARLEKEGLFAASRKKDLPAFPRRIGLVTSPTGAAAHDFLEVLRRRWRGVHVILIPARVQGEGAAEEIERGIHLAQRIEPSLDILVVGRGGGSMEDLWCFNEERVVRAIAGCSIPTVSAVGHEIDVTLADLAADVRALTPTEAAERILPDANELMSRLVESHHRLNRSVLRRVQEAKQHLRLLAERPILKDPMEQMQLRRQRLDELQDRMERHWSMRLERARSPIDRLAGQLAALNPLEVFRRGYSVVRRQDNQQVVDTIESAQTGMPIEVLLRDGRLMAKVDQIDAKLLLREWNEKLSANDRQ
jgi:exodeoxyribonuclease VII large subunit